LKQELAMQRHVGIVLTLVVLLGCRGEPAAEPSSPAAASPAEHRSERVVLSPAAVSGLGLKTVEAERRVLDAMIRATAVIRANENRLAHVSPRIPGKAVEVRAVLGDRVAAGQALAFLDSLELGEKKSALLQARANLEVARRNYQREARLFKQRISSEKDYLEAKGEFERSDAAFRAAREALRLLGLTDAAIEQITWGGKDHPLSHFPILAPFAGAVIEQHITLGELIKPEEKPYTIADLTTLWILLDVYEKDLSRIGVGTAAEVRVDAYPDERFAGHIVYVSDVLDETTRTARARVEVDNHAGRLRPGMFATAVVTLPSDAPIGAVTIPVAAVQRINGRPVAFVEESAGSFAVRQLTLGRDTDTMIEVKHGVAEGERVVTEGSFTLKSEVLKDQLAGED
jgi:cobalt-zinc-cadmium efflux system membrane fusion protein